MTDVWEHHGALLTVRVHPFYADVLSVVDEQDGEPLPPILFAPQDELNARAEEVWAFAQ